MTTPDTLSIDRVLLQIVFDCAVNSMDFGSGFLDDEEVAALRSVAELLGVDPMNATPHNFSCKYSGTCEPWGLSNPRYANQCKNCRRTVV